MDLRWYQSEAIESGIKAIGEFYNPVIVLPTGSGKTVVLSGLAEEYIMENPGDKILIMSHVKEILDQNYKTLTYWLGNIVGIYSAGLGERNTNFPVTVAGIQSINNLKDESFFDDVGLIIVDECHRVGHRNKGTYRKVIERCRRANVCGLTATPYRLGHGYIYQGEDTIFDTIAYDGGTMHNYNRLVDEGYLSKIYAKSTNLSLNLDKVRTTAGDFNKQDLSKSVDREEITNQAVQEIVEFGKNYKNWLIFAIDINHAEHIRTQLVERGIETGIVHSKMEDRDGELRRFKAGKYRAMVNVDVLTTGFDYPDIDLIGMLRPTKSPVIHVQTVGRGARVSPGKDHCLFLDFAGNTERLGPINDIKIKQKSGKKKAGGDPITKTCPECGVIYHPSVKVCDACGHEFKFKQNLKTSATDAEIVRKKEKKKKLPAGFVDWVDVDRISYSVTNRPGRPSSMRVSYHCGLNTFSEWIAYGQKNYAGHRARHWVKYRWPNTLTMPRDLGDLLLNKHILRAAKKIKVDTRGKYTQIVDAMF